MSRVLDVGAPGLGPWRPVAGGPRTVEMATPTRPMADTAFLRRAARALREADRDLAARRDAEAAVAAWHGQSMFARPERERLLDAWAGRPAVDFANPPADPAAAERERLLDAWRKSSG